MSSLWTPEGERPVGRPTPGPATDSAAGPAHQARPGTPPTPGPGEAEAELERLRRELLRAPAAVVVANHAYGLFELAALHLSAQPPNLGEARLAVDALGAVVETLGDRLGEAAGPLHDALAQIRLAFVQVSAAGTVPADPSTAPPTP